MVESQEAHQQFKNPIVDGLHFHPQVQDAGEYRTPTHIVQTLTMGDKSIRIISPDDRTDVRYTVLDTNFPTHVNNFQLGEISGLTQITIKQLQRHNSGGRVVEITGTQNGQPFHEHVIIGRDTHRLVLATPSNVHKKTILHLDSELRLTQLPGPLKNPKKGVFEVGIFKPNVQSVIQQDSVHRRYPTAREREDTQATTIKELFDKAITNQKALDALTIATAYMLQLRDEYQHKIPTLGELLQSATTQKHTTQNSPPLHLSDDIAQRTPLVRTEEIHGMKYVFSRETESLHCVVGFKKNRPYIGLHLETAPTLRYRFLPILPSTSREESMHIATVQSTGEYNTQSHIMLSYFDHTYEKPDHCIMVSLDEIKQMILNGEIVDSRIISAIALIEHYLETEKLIAVETGSRTPSLPLSIPGITPMRPRNMPK